MNLDNTFGDLIGNVGQASAPRSNGEDPISQAEIGKRWPALQSVASDILSRVGPSFTQTPYLHIQTDIAAVASLAGLMLLQETVADLMTPILQVGPGNVILSVVHAGRELVIRFMAGAAMGSGLNPEGLFQLVPEGNDPMFACEEMVSRLAPCFYSACAREKLDRNYYKFAAALASVRLIGAGMEMQILDQRIGGSIASYYLVAGSKTLPYLNALWQL